MDLHENKEEGFRIACGNGHFEIVKFLTTSKELLSAGLTFVDIHANDEDGFVWACENHHWNVVQFLIFDLQIERTPTLNAIIKKQPQAEELFRVREEQEQIRKSLIGSCCTVERSSTQNSKDDSSRFFPFRI